MAGSEWGDEDASELWNAGWRNDLGGTVYGSSVQAGVIHGGVRFHVGSPQATPRPQQLPRPPADFIGRGAEMERLDLLLDERVSRQATLVVVITGVAGVGKTALALGWLQRALPRFPDGQLYADLGGWSSAAAAEPGEVLGQFLRALGVPPPRVPDHLSERAGLFRSLTSGRRLALLLDNAISAGQARSLLPRGGPSLVVITSRLRIGGLVRDGARFVELDPLAESAAVELLGRILGADRARAEMGAARRLAALCGGLPIAVCASAARLAARPRWSVKSMVERLVREQERLAGLSVEEDVSVRAAFDMSYRGLQPEVARLYRLLGTCTGTHFDSAVAAACAGTSREDGEYLLEALVDAHLLEETAESRYRFHELVRLHAREMASEEEPAEERKAALRRVMCYFLRKATGANQLIRPYQRDRPRSAEPSPSMAEFAGPAEALDWLEAERRNILATMRASMEHGSPQKIWQIVRQMWPLFLHRRHFQQWIEFASIGTRAAEECEEPAGEAMMLDQLGAAFTELGQYDKADEHFRRAQAIWHRLSDRHRIAGSRRRLGSVAVRRDFHDQAVNHFTAALHIHRELNEPRWVAISQVQLGIALIESGRPHEAMPHLREAHRLLGEQSDPYNQAQALTMLGRAHIHSGETGPAAAYLHEALATTRGIGSPPGQAEALEALGELGQRVGRVDQARRYYEEAFAIRTHLGDEHAARLRSRLRGLGPAN